MESGADVYVREEQAFVASLGDGGYGLARVEPLYVVGMDIEQLADALEKVYRGGIGQLAVQESSESRHVDPLPLAVAAQSGRPMDDAGLLYRVDWGQHATAVEVFQAQNGRWEEISSMHFVAEVTSHALAKAIIDDAQSHSGI